MPALTTMGFSGKTSSFQRFDNQWLDLISIQYWKYGGEFLLEFGRIERKPLQKSWGVVPEHEIEIGHLDPMMRARLETKDAKTMFRGFVFSGFGEDVAKYEAVAKQVAEFLPQVDEWLRNNKIGPNVFTFKPAS